MDSSPFTHPPMPTQSRAIKPKPFTSKTAEGIRARMLQAIKSVFGSVGAMRNKYDPGTVGHRTANAFSKQMQRAGKKGDISASTVLAVAAMTQRRVGWLLTAEEPEHAGVTVERGELAADIAAFIAADLLLTSKYDVPPNAFAVDGEHALNQMVSAARDGLEELQGIYEEQSIQVVADRILHAQPSMSELSRAVRALRQRQRAKAKAQEADTEMRCAVVRRSAQGARHRPFGGSFVALGSPRGA